MDKQEIINFVVNELVGGKGLQQTCRDNNLSYAKIYGWMRKAGHRELVTKSKGNSTAYKTCKPCILTEIDICRITNMYIDRQMTLAEIAKELRVNKVTVFNFCKKYNVPLRSKEEGTRLYHSRPDVKEATRIRMKRLALLGVTGVLRKQKYYNTQPELHFLEWCIEQNYDTIQQFRIIQGGHPYDFYIVGTNLLVEIDGHYWHQKPEQKIKDDEQAIEAANMGFEVIRIVDLDQKNNDCYDILKEKIYEQLQHNVD